VLVAPLTSRLQKGDAQEYRAHRVRLAPSKRIDFRILGNEKPLEGASLVLTEQVRVFAHARLEGNPVAQVSLETMAVIEAGLKHVLDLG
jgi:mRNA-degrading endonuclease toxin of MazEF toxin-antitoxin module